MEKHKPERKKKREAEKKFHFQNFYATKKVMQ
jgi:hypothetical protein